VARQFRSLINKDLRPLQVYCPPLELQLEYSNNVAKVDMLARALGAAAAKTEKMAAALAAEIFDARPAAAATRRSRQASRRTDNTHAVAAPGTDQP
jgi:hypothetical protein